MKREMYSGDLGFRLMKYKKALNMCKKKHTATSEKLRRL
jgi:hypothetical protein